MGKQTRQKKTLRPGIIRTPGYPFTARELFGDLFTRLAKESGEVPTFQRLGELVGRSKSTAHHWFGISEQPQVVALLCLLERLSEAQRQNFIESHCRVMPSFEHTAFAHEPANTGQLLELLRQPSGLTVVCGGTDEMRRFLVSAAGHAYRRAYGPKQRVTGIDVDRPNKMVPVESVFHVDPFQSPSELKACLLNIWPRVQTASATLVILNGIWQRIPELRPEILRCANHKHVVLAESGVPDLHAVRSRVSTPLHVVSVSAAQHISGGILVNCRRVRPPKRPKTTHSA